MPFLATAALPTQGCEIVKSNGWLCSFSQAQIDREAPRFQQIQGHVLMILVPAHPFFEKAGSLEILRRQLQRICERFKR